MVACSWIYRSIHTPYVRICTGASWNKMHFCHLTSIRKAAEGREEARAMQAYPEGWVQNNKGWVSVLVVNSPHPSCVLTDSGLNPYPVLKIAFPVIQSQQPESNRSVLSSPVSPCWWKSGGKWTNNFHVLSGLRFCCDDQLMIFDHDEWFVVLSRSRVNLCVLTINTKIIIRREPAFYVKVTQ